MGFDPSGRDTGHRALLEIRNQTLDCGIRWVLDVDIRRLFHCRRREGDTLSVGTKEETPRQRGDGIQSLGEPGLLGTKVVQVG